MLRERASNPLFERGLSLHQWPEVEMYFCLLDFKVQILHLIQITFEFIVLTRLI